MNTTTTKSKDLVTVNNEHSSTIKKVFKEILIFLGLVLISFTIGYFSGEYNQKNKTISEIQYTLSSDYGLDEWQILEMAIAKTESEFNRYAIGKTNDYGILQITPVYVKDVNRISNNHYQLTDAFDIKKSLEMFSIMQKHYNSEYDIDKAINLHNPHGKSVNYAERVYSNIIFIKRMEEVRKEIIVNNLYKNDNVVLTEIIKDCKNADDTARDIKVTNLTAKPVDKIKICK